MVVENQIRQAVSSTLRSAKPGDIVRNARYENHPAARFLKLTSGFTLHAHPNWKAGIDYTHKGSGGDERNPRHRIRTSLKISPFSSASLTATGDFISETDWPEFRVSAADNDKDGQPLDGRTPAAFLVGVEAGYNFKPLLVFPEVWLRLEVSNIFNDEYRSVPIGNLLDTAVSVQVGATL